MAYLEFSGRPIHAHTRSLRLFLPRLGTFPRICRGAAAYRNDLGIVTNIGTIALHNGTPFNLGREHTSRRRRRLRRLQVYYLLRVLVLLLFKLAALNRRRSRQRANFPMK